jgi:hypothetical protein
MNYLCLISELQYKSFLIINYKQTNILFSLLKLFCKHIKNVDK